PIDRKLAANLRRWQESGAPKAWCAAHQGRWSHAEWLKLLSGLWWSEYWPMDPAAVRGILEELAKPWNLQRWRQSGQPWQWIASNRGIWNHDDWLTLLDELRGSEFWPLDPAAVGAVLEELRPRWRNLERWKQSGQPLRWVESRHGRWDHADWLAL